MQRDANEVVERIELCEELCPDNCVYRVPLNGTNLPICYYCVMENVPTRGCKISECDKYKAGAKTQPRMKPEYIIEWDIELYGRSEDDYTVR